MEEQEREPISSGERPHYANRNGNYIPPHGLGPAQYMNIAREDTFTHDGFYSYAIHGRNFTPRSNYAADHK
jgi:hypothetical protein